MSNNIIEIAAQAMHVTIEDAQNIIRLLMVSTHSILESCSWWSGRNRIRRRRKACRDIFPKL